VPQQGWQIYREEAAYRYDCANNDHGPRDTYLEEATAIFIKVARGSKGHVKRQIRAGIVPMPAGYNAEAA
jgi:hypothetical protein